MYNTNIFCIGDGESLTLLEIAAQSFIFFAAGYETSSAAATFALYELAVNQDIQNKIKVELRTILKKYNNQLTYEAFHDLVYMQQVMDGKL